MPPSSSGLELKQKKSPPGSHANGIKCVVLKVKTGPSVLYRKELVEHILMFSTPKARSLWDTAIDPAKEIVHLGGKGESEATFDLT
jgi:hypothetical protein